MESRNCFTFVWFFITRQSFFASNFLTFKIIVSLWYSAILRFLQANKFYFVLLVNIFLSLTIDCIRNHTKSPPFGTYQSPCNSQYNSFLKHIFEINLLLFLIGMVIFIIFCIFSRTLLMNASSDRDESSGSDQEDNVEADPV